MPHTQPDEHSIMLWPDRPPQSATGDSFKPWLDFYPAAADIPRGLIVVCPGGGYGGRAAHEGEPVARAFNDMGLHAAVVLYRVSPNRHPAPLMDVARAIRIVRHHAARWMVDPQRIGVCGFSAGGHLAASIGVHYGLDTAGVNDPIAKESCRPDALVLCYSVISGGAHRHHGSFVNLLGQNPSQEQIDLMWLENHVTSDTPPAFLWHTADDAVVDVENSVQFALALRQFKTPFELHIYPAGRHGLGLSKDDSHIASWTSLCRGFFQNQGWLEK